MPTTLTRPSSIPQRLGRRILASKTLDVLATPHGVDRYLELIRPTWTVSDGRATVTRVRRQTPRTVTVTLRPNGAWAGFGAGQFVRVGVEIDGVRRTRCYSPASSASIDGELELTVTAHPDGLVSNHLIAHARTGDVIHLDPAEGEFVLPATRPDDLLLIAGGSGVTPVLSMLRTLCDEGHSGRIGFLQYVRTEADALYGPELAALSRRHPGLRTAVVATRQDTAPLRGHFDEAHVEAVLDAGVGGQVAVCGPPGLIDSVRAAWERAGAGGLVLSETFTPPTLTVSGAATSGTLRFLDTGAQAPIGEGTLLEQAEAAGLQPEFGCRMGICHSCTCRKAAGPVRNLISGEISEEEDEDIRLCVSVPAGDVALAI